jgi:hypothetical protein
VSDLVDLFDETPTYTTGDVARLSGLPPILIHRLAAAGVISSTVPAAGSGTRRRWSGAELDRLCRIGDVYRAGHGAGVLLTWQAVADMWAAMEAGDAWELVLSA